MSDTQRPMSEWIIEVRQRAELAAEVTLPIHQFMGLLDYCDYLQDALKHLAATRQPLRKMPEAVFEVIKFIKSDLCICSSIDEECPACEVSDCIDRHYAVTDSPRGGEGEPG